MTNEVELVACVRAALAGVGPITEVKMFGGLGFLLNGNLIAGASPRGLLLRVGSERAAEALRQPGARPMVMRGRTMADYVYVDPPALDIDSVSFALRLALPYVQALPPKAHAAAKPRKAAKRGQAGKPEKAKRAVRIRAARSTKRRLMQAASGARSRRGPSGQLRGGRGRRGR